MYKRQSGACTSATGLICDTSNNDRCSAIPTCATTDGTAANPANCRCGTTDCDADTTGLFCHAPQNLCADYAHPRKVYPIVTSGTCEGYGWIADKAACEATAGQAGWSDTTAHTYSTTNKPRGCYDTRSSTSGGSLWFNTNTASTISCDYSNSKACLCAAFTGPACPHDDGATANPAPCVCGTSGICNSYTGFFCDAAKNQCDDVPYCATTDGLSLIHI